MYLIFKQVAAAPVQKSKAEIGRPLRLSVSVKAADGKYQFVQIEVPSRAKVATVIEEVLREAPKQRAIMFRSTDPAVYQLMLVRNFL